MDMMTPKSRIFHKMHDMQLRFRENLVAIVVIVLICLWVVMMGA